MTRKEKVQRSHFLWFYHILYQFLR